MIFEKQVIKMYKAMAYTRCDDNGTAFYFSAEDFPGLHKESYVFESSMGHKLQGYIYNYDEPQEGRLIVFDHGFGGGHRSYMKEIELLARHGYRVFAYDHTGCMESGGETPNGMSQSLHDLDDCIRAVKLDPQFAGTDISVVGHSWGGFSTLNISALHPEISKIVVMSGFVSVERLINSYFGGIMKLYRKAIMDLENKANPEYVSFDAVCSLKKSQAKALLIYSDNDQRCHKDASYDVLKAELEGRPDTEFMLVSGRDHNPNYTEDAVKYLGEYLADLAAKNKKKLLETKEQKDAFLASFDWDRMTMQDETVWKTIFRFLDN